MPHYHRYGLRLGKVGICILENYNSPPAGEALVVQSPAFPTCLPVTKPGISVARIEMYTA